MWMEYFNVVRPEVFITAVVLVAVFTLDKFLKWRKGKLPPGPLGLPIVGYLPFLTKHSHLKFTKLAQKYGDVFSLYLGSQLVVVLNDGDSVREAFAKREFLGRPPNSAFSIFGFDTPFFTPHIEIWQEQRRFVVHVMKDLGLGKSKIEGHIQEEIQYFLKVLEETKGKSMDLSKPLTPSMSNNICALVFGERYDYNDPTRLLLDHALNNVGRAAAQTSVHIFFPWIRRIPFLVRLLNYENAIKAFTSVANVVKGKVADHKKTLDPQNIRDYIDGYLVEMKSRVAKDPKTTFSDAALEGTVMNFFGAGSETVRTSVSWSMYILAAYPEIQKKLHKEITEVLGSSRFPQITDQKDMPYTQAFIREVLRWKTVAPLNVLRYTIDDTSASGYFVPKGTVVIANLWAVHLHPKHWKNPEEFNPERFLSKDGTLLKNDYFMPFSVGKRACPGEAMALMEIFLYLTAILQKFLVSFPAGFKPTFEAELGITYSLKPFEICFKSK